MKHLSTVDSSQQKELFSIFPDIDKVLEMEETSIYKQKSISVFDHWLTLEEGIEFLDGVSKKEQERRNFLHKNFQTVLIENLQLYGYSYFSNIQKRKFVQFPLSSEISKYFEHSFCVVMPEIKSIYVSGFDDTNHLYFQNESEIEILKPFISNAKLWLI